MKDTIPFDAAIARAIATLRRAMLDDGSIGQYLFALLMVKHACRTSFDHLLRNAREPGNARRIEDALLQVEEANPVLADQELKGPLFSHRDRDSSHEVNKALGDLIELFSREESLASPGARSIDPTLELLAHSPHGRAGEFHTPRAIVAFMVDILSPKSGETIYDPVCSSGGFLASALDHFRKRNAGGTLPVFGQERSPTVARIAALNLLFHGVDQKSVYTGDALMQPIGAGYDMVISNPPFSQTYDDLSPELREVLDRFAPGMPPPARADYAFVLQMLASLKSGTGRMAVIMPPGALYRIGSEREIRRNLIERNLLDAVIALPPKLFLGTSISAVVMFFRHGRKDESVLFIDASEDFEPGRKQNVLRNQDIERIVAAYRKRTEDLPYSRLVSRAEIKANNFNLTVSRYFDRSSPYEAADPEELSARESALRAELADLQKQIDGCLNELQLTRDRAW